MVQYFLHAKDVAGGNRVILSWGSLCGATVDGQNDACPCVSESLAGIVVYLKTRQSQVSGSMHLSQ